MTQERILWVVAIGSQSGDTFTATALQVGGAGFAGGPPPGAAQQNP